MLPMQYGGGVWILLSYINGFPIKIPLQNCKVNNVRTALHSLKCNSKFLSGLIPLNEH